MKTNLYITNPIKFATKLESPSFTVCDLGQNNFPEWFLCKEIDLGDNFTSGLYEFCREMLEGKEKSIKDSLNSELQSISRQLEELSKS